MTEEMDHGKQKEYPSLEHVQIAIASQEDLDVGKKQQPWSDDMGLAAEEDEEEVVPVLVVYNMLAPHRRACWPCGTYSSQMGTGQADQLHLRTIYSLILQK